ncbi:protein of unknown function [Rhodovastum atsumiense]|nr:protein of unknown function [Rhodovastum atsumiense]
MLAIRHFLRYTLRPSQESPVLNRTFASKAQRIRAAMMPSPFPHACLLAEVPCVREHVSR